MLVVISGLMIPAPAIGAWPALTKLTCQIQAAALNYVRHGPRGHPREGVDQSGARIAGKSQLKAEKGSSVEAVPIDDLRTRLDLLEFKISLGIYRLREKSLIWP